MRFLAIAPLLSLVFVPARAGPIRHETRGIINSASVLDDVLLFDAPAFPDPHNPSNSLIGLQAFVSLQLIDLKPLTAGVTKALELLGISIGDGLTNLEGRLKLFGTIGLSGKTVNVKVSGCSGNVTLGKTSGLPDLGMVLANVSAGACDSAKQLQASASVAGRDFGATIFSAPNEGFGVISDIDDTVKISNTLDKLKLIQTTLLDDPQPVAGMPELYASLAKSLKSPQFIYVSGSPFQLYPFLNGFINTTYSASKGPILLQNLTLVDIPGLLDFAKSDGIFEYKSAMIDRIYGMYPQKRFLTVGDSTQKDPETYGEAFRKFGDFIACAWIRKVDGANNTDARFAEAFKNVPQNKFRIYTDAEIPSLQTIDVAGGNC